MSKVEITDEYGPTVQGTTTVEMYDVASTIRPWFPDAPQDVTDAIDEFQTRLLHGEDVTAVATFLGLIVSAPDHD